MKPTEILSREHRVIEQVLDCLDQIIANADRTGKFDKASATDAVNFFRTFADQCHHRKEEAHLFPAMEAKGFSHESGSISVMIAEHEQGRACVRQMREAIATGAVQPFAEAGRRYSEMLRQHIKKEDHCLFDMADNAFNAADQAVLLAKFEKVEAEEMDAGTHEKFLSIAEALAKKFGVAMQTGHEHACCHH